HIFNLAITNGDDRSWIANVFSAAIGRTLCSLPGDPMCGRKVETVVLDDRSSDAEVQKALERARGADLVVASLYGRVRTGQARSVGLPEPGAKALSAFIGSKLPLITISFGNPYLLQSFPELRTYVVAYGDMPSLQQAAARALLGEIDITGRLPISLPGLYPRGTGIQLKRRAMSAQKSFLECGDLSLLFVRRDLSRRCWRQVASAQSADRSAHSKIAAAE